MQPFVSVALGGGTRLHLPAHMLMDPAIVGASTRLPREGGPPLSLMGEAAVPGLVSLGPAGLDGIQGGGEGGGGDSFEDRVWHNLERYIGAEKVPILRDILQNDEVAHTLLTNVGDKHGLTTTHGLLLEVQHQTPDHAITPALLSRFMALPEERIGERLGYLVEKGVLERTGDGGFRLKSPYLGDRLYDVFTKFAVENFVRDKQPPTNIEEFYYQMECWQSAMEELAQVFSPVWGNNFSTLDKVRDELGLLEKQLLNSALYLELKYLFRRMDLSYFMTFTDKKTRLPGARLTVDDGVEAAVAALGIYRILSYHQAFGRRDLVLQVEMLLRGRSERGTRDALQVGRQVTIPAQAFLTQRGFKPLGPMGFFVPGTAEFPAAAFPSGEAPDEAEMAGPMPFMGTTVPFDELERTVNRLAQSLGGYYLVWPFYDEKYGVREFACLPPSRHHLVCGNQDLYFVAEDPLRTAICRQLDENLTLRAKTEDGRVAVYTFLPGVAAESGLNALKQITRNGKGWYERAAQAVISLPLLAEEEKEIERRGDFTETEKIYYAGGLLCIEPVIKPEQATIEQAKAKPGLAFLASLLPIFIPDEITHGQTIGSAANLNALLSQADSTRAGQIFYLRLLLFQITLFLTDRKWYRGQFLTLAFLLSCFKVEAGECVIDSARLAALPEQINQLFKGEYPSMAGRIRANAAVKDAEENLEGSVLATALKYWREELGRPFNELSDVVDFLLVRAGLLELPQSQIEACYANFENSFVHRKGRPLSLSEVDFTKEGVANEQRWLVLDRLVEAGKVELLDDGKYQVAQAVQEREQASVLAALDAQKLARLAPRQGYAWRAMPRVQDSLPERAAMRDLFAHNAVHTAVFRLDVDEDLLENTDSGGEYILDLDRCGENVYSLRAEALARLKQAKSAFLVIKGEMAAVYVGADISEGNRIFTDKVANLTQEVVRK